MEKTFRRIKRMVIAIIGFTVLLVGIAMIVLPGPAILVIPPGLAILATEFVWARRLLKRVRDKFPRQRRPELGNEIHSIVRQSGQIRRAILMLSNLRFYPDKLKINFISLIRTKDRGDF